MAETRDADAPVVKESYESEQEAQIAANKLASIHR